MLNLSDFRHAGRLLRKSPWFALATVLVLAGGLAISIYTWSVLDTMVYKDLPIADGHSVVRLVGERDGRYTRVDAFTLAQMRPAIRRLQDIGVYANGDVLLGGDDAVRSVDALYAQRGIFDFTRTPPLLGRGFVRGDDIDGAEAVTVLSYRIWQSVFAGDPAIVDKVIRIDRKPVRVVGVMPEGYAFPIAADLWLPLSTRAIEPADWTDDAYDAWARLRPGVSMADANAELATLLRRVQQQYPRPGDGRRALDGVRVDTFQMAQTDAQGGMVFAVLNVVSLFILLLACVNVGNMLLARTNERLREIAVRVALGAPRWRLTLQMMLESVAICVAGGLLALALAGWLLHATNRFMDSNFEGNLPYWWHWGLDGGAALAAGLFVLLAIVLVSALPTFSATGVHPNTLLRDGTRGARGRTSGRISRTLVTVQIVLISMVMLVGSAVALIAWRTAHIDIGMDTTNLVRMPVDLSGEAYDTPDRQLQFYQRLLGQLRNDPAIGAAVVRAGSGRSAFAVDGIDYATPDDYPQAAVVTTSTTPRPIGLTLLQGRLFDDRDRTGGLETALVSETVARTCWPGASALGQRIRLVGEDGTVQGQRIVVGVVGDVRRGDDLLVTDRNTYASIYVPLAQSATASASVLVRHRGNEDAARAAMYRILSGIDPSVIPGAIVSYTEVQQKMTLMATTLTDLFAYCGLFAVLLALTGIYGLTSNAVVQRTHEIGLRRAIGASDGAIVALFLRQGGRQLAVSLGLALLVAAGILYLLAKFAGIGAATLALIGMLVAATVSALVLAAIYVSTRRAVRHEPAVALRHE